MIELDEQAEPLPTPSLAVARKVVDESSATDTVSPAAAKSAAEPVATGLPLQVGSVKSLTVEPAAAEPFTLGEVVVRRRVGIEITQRRRSWRRRVLDIGD